jgi:hypothetical protein
MDYSASIRLSGNVLTKPLPNNGHIRPNITLPVILVKVVGLFPSGFQVEPFYVAPFSRLFYYLTTLILSRLYNVGDRMIMNMEQLMERELTGKPSKK